MPGLEIALLGSPRVTINGEPVSVDTRKAIALLAYLAVTGQVHRRDRLAALLWPEADHDHARAALRRTLSALNGALDGAWLAATRDTIALQQLPDLDLDVARFRSTIAAAREDPARRTELLETAAGLHRGTFMDGFHLRDSPEFDDWRYLEGEALRRDLAWALDQLSARYGERNDFEAAISCALRWLALDSLHEEAHRRLMALYARSGQTAAAVRQYRECVRILDQELGVEPLVATTALYQAIQERRELEPASEAGAATTGDHAWTTVGSPAREHPVVGREQELATLAAALDGAESGGQLVVIEGEAGIGKTRLVEEFFGRMHARGARTLTLRCYEGESELAYGPLVDAFKAILRGSDGERVIAALSGRTLGEVGRLLPELFASRADINQPAPLDSPGAKARFYDAMVETLQQAVAGDRTGALFVDDAQWADSATLDFLSYFAHRLAGRALLVLAWRPGDAPEGHRLRSLTAGSNSTGTTQVISLTRLQQRDVAALARDVTGEASDVDELSNRLYQETDGLPFFVVQYLDELRSRHGQAAEAAWPIPGGVRALLTARLAALSSEELQMLTTLAAAGSACSFDLLVEASGRSEDEAAFALEKLLARALVVERLDGAVAQQLPLYDVSHASLRELVYAETSLLRRRLLHRRIAGALARQGSGQSRRPEFARIAVHLRLAGEYREAAGAYRQAGEAAAALYANREAIGYFESALALGDEDAAEIHERIGDLQTHEGRFELALAAYEKAAALCDPSAEGRVEHKLGAIFHRLGEWVLAERHYAATKRILTEAGTDVDPAELARLYVDWGLAAHRQGDRERAARLGRQALELAREAGDLLAVAQSHNLLGILARTAGEAGARAHLEESLRLAVELDDPAARAAALNNLALLEHAASNTARAIELGEEALALAILQGDRHRVAALHSNLADYRYAAGQEAASMEHLQHSAIIYAEIGVVAGERHAEIWKLAEW